MKQSLSGESGYSNLDQTSNPTEYVRKLDERASSTFWKGIKTQMFSLLDPREGDRVLDIGCGTGEDVRAIAQAVGPRGRAVGLDKSSIIVNIARRRTEKSNSSIEFYVGDAHHLEFPDDSFDCCRAERVLQHMDNPRQALAEIARVAKPGARIVVVEPDYGATSITGGDPLVTRRLLNYRSAHYRSGRIGMHLPILFKQLRLVNITFTPIQAVITKLDNEGEKLLRENYTEPATAAGSISEVEAIKWIKDIKHADTASRYQHSTTLFLVSGRK